MSESEALLKKLVGSPSQYKAKEFLDEIQLSLDGGRLTAPEDVVMFGAEAPDSVPDVTIVPIKKPSPPRANLPVIVPEITKKDIIDDKRSDWYASIKAEAIIPQDKIAEFIKIMGSVGVTSHTIVNAPGKFHVVVYRTQEEAKRWQGRTNSQLT